jgi:PcfJ-like protein
MGGMTHKLQLKRAEAEQEMVAAFARHNARKGEERAIKRDDWTYIITPAMQAWSGFWVRPLENWTPSIRSSDDARLRMDLLRHLFGLYPVPGFLEKIWLPPNGIVRHLSLSEQEKAKRQRQMPYQKGMADNPEFEEFAGWYVATATGLSLWKEASSSYLSRRETHLFLHAPNEFTPSRNIWWARARSWGATKGGADNIARCKLTRMDVKNDFWISVGRLFARHPELGHHAADDLIDFLEAHKREDENYSLKGRTLATISEASEVWHRLQAKQKHYGVYSWEGMPISDWSYITGNPEKEATHIWGVCQIKTGMELVQEGQAMRHCVGSYRVACSQGRSSVFSLTYDEARVLTIECQKERIVQVRGKANRRASSMERIIVYRWAMENDLLFDHYAL